MKRTKMQQNALALLSLVCQCLTSPREEDGELRILCEPKGALGKGRPKSKTCWLSRDLLGAGPLPSPALEWPGCRRWWDLGRWWLGDSAEMSEGLCWWDCSWASVASPLQWVRSVLVMGWVLSISDSSEEDWDPSMVVELLLPKY